MNRDTLVDRGAGSGQSQSGRYVCQIIVWEWGVYSVKIGDSETIFDFAIALGAGLMKLLGFVALILSVFGAER